MEASPDFLRLLLVDGRHVYLGKGATASGSRHLSSATTSFDITTAVKCIYSRGRMNDYKTA